VVRWLASRVLGPWRTLRGQQMNDPLDVSLCDHELLAELEMMTNLIIAASEAEGVLTQPVMDRVLGL